MAGGQLTYSRGFTGSAPSAAPAALAPATGAPASGAAAALYAPGAAAYGYDGPQYGMLPTAVPATPRPQLVAYEPVRYRYRIRWENVLPLLALVSLIVITAVATPLLRHAHGASTTTGGGMAGMDMGTGLPSTAPPTAAAKTKARPARSARAVAKQKPTPAAKTKARQPARTTAAKLPATAPVRPATAQAVQHTTAPAGGPAAAPATAAKPASKPAASKPAAKQPATVKHKAPSAPTGGGGSSTKPAQAVTPPAGGATAGAPPAAPGGPATQGTPQTPMPQGMVMPAGTM